MLPRFRSLSSSVSLQDPLLYAFKSDSGEGYLTRQFTNRGHSLWSETTYMCNMLLEIAYHSSHFFISFISFVLWISIVKRKKEVVPTQVYVFSFVVVRSVLTCALSLLTNHRWCFCYLLIKPFAF